MRRQYGSMACLAVVCMLALLAAHPAARAADDTALRLTNSDGSHTAYARVPNDAAFAMQTFTLEAWVQRVGTGYGFTTDPSGAAIIAKPQENVSGSNIASWHFHWTNDGRILFNLVHTPGSSGVYLSSSAVATPLARHHIAVTFDGSTIRLYIDGVADATAAWSLGTVYYGNNDVLIGADNFALGYYRRFDGYIDDARVWNIARSAADIANTMNCRLVGNETGLVAYWSYDGSNLVDLTGHGHDGVVQGLPAFLTYAPLTSLSECTVGVGDARAAFASRAALRVYPQPSRDRVTASFDLPRPGRATVAIVDVAGRRLATVTSGEFPAGHHEVAASLASLGLSRAGVLFVRLDWEGGRESRPLALVH